MEILERGIPPEERDHQATCINCWTKIAFKQKEAKVNHDQRDGDYLSIACPVCNRTITKSLQQRIGVYYDR